MSSQLPILAPQHPHLGLSEDLPLTLVVEPGQKLYALIGAENCPAVVWTAGPDGSSHCQELNGATTLALEIPRNGELTLWLDPSSEGSTHGWVDYLLYDSRESLTPAENLWLNAFQAAQSWLEGASLTAPDTLARAFAAGEFYREADSCISMISERLWEHQHYGEAREVLLAGLAEALVGVDPSVEAQRNHRLGEMETRLGYFSDATEHLGRAARLRHHLGLTQAEAMSHYALGNVHTITGDLDLAESAYQQALMLLGSGQQQSRYILLELGWLARRRNDYTQAIHIFKDLIRQAQASGDIYLQMETHDRLGSTLGLAGRFAEGEQALIESGRLIESYDGDRKTLHAINFSNLAFLCMGWKKYELALGYVDKALELYSGETFQEGRLTTYWTKGCVLRELGRGEEALEQFDLCLKEAEAIRAKSNFGFEGAMFFQYSLQDIEDIFHLCWTLNQQLPLGGHRERAFLFLERLRARGLAEFLGPTKDEFHPPDKRLHALITPKATPSFLPQMMDQSSLVSADLLIGTLQHQLLKENQGVLAYFLGERAGYWWLLTQSGLEMGLLPPRAQLESQIGVFLESLQEPSAFGPQQQNLLARNLSHQLLPEHAKLKKLEHLYILPDGLLFRLPFALLTLVDSDSTDPNLLIKKRSLSYLPSASFELSLHGRKRRNDKEPRGLLVFADPVFNGSDPRIGKSGPQRHGPEAFPRLPYSDRERLLLLALDRQIPVQSYNGFQASRDHFLKESLAQYQVIHLATHALCIPEQTGLSGLVFAMVNEHGEPLDAYLNSGEIRNLQLQAELVVLSACSGADGPLFRGEGLMGLARSFLEAGACAVLASLWDVDDEATAVLMNYFYQALLKGQSSGQALQVAQNRMAQSRRWSAPKYWAGFCLIGDSRKIF